MDVIKRVNEINKKNDFYLDTALGKLKEIYKSVTSANLSKITGITTAQLSRFKSKKNMLPLDKYVRIYCLISNRIKTYKGGQLDDQMDVTCSTLDQELARKKRSSEKKILQRRKNKETSSDNDEGSIKFLNETKSFLENLDHTDIKLILHHYMHDLALFEKNYKANKEQISIEIWAKLFERMNEK